MEIAFQLDHPAKLNARGDTSFALIEEAQKRGHTVYFYEAPMLSWQAGDVSAPLTPITLDFSHNPVWALGETKRRSLREMAVVMMRQDPPFDMSYITATHLLERIVDTVRVVNDPAGVRNAPEKLSILPLTEFLPPTLISIDPQAIAAFADAHTAIIAKPLYGFGGRAVYKLNRDDPNIATLIEQWREQSREPLMWQAFLPEVAQGDRRILMIDGVVASVFGRTPESGSIRANMRVGGTPVKAELTPKQEKICAALKPFLKREKLLIAGVDVIGDYLTEINVTSPTGFRAAGALYGVNVAAQVWDTIEASL
ncbi:MAG: glutathione synthase [Rickettsiales bacterium]